MSGLFIDPKGSFICTNETVGEVYDVIPETSEGFFQLCFLCVIYGVILYEASNLIAEGSDLLLLILNPGFVGGFVLPVFGAIPDGAIILFSGMGSREKAQKSLEIGIGTLAGSTIMLLTLPWFLATYYGRVNLIGNPPEAHYCTHDGLPKLSPRRNIFTTGVTPAKEITRAGIIMMMTALVYLVIQGPAFQYLHTKDEELVAKREKTWALVAFICSLLAFLANCTYQIYSANAHEAQKKKIEARRAIAFQHHVVDLAFLLSEEDHSALGSVQDPEGAPLVNSHTQVERIMRRNFDKYDEDRDGDLNHSEVRAMLKDLHVSADPRDATRMIEIMDKDNDGKISFEEFKATTVNWLVEQENDSGLTSPKRAVHRRLSQQLSYGSTLSPSHMQHIPEYLEDHEENEDDQEESMTPADVVRISMTKLILGVLIVSFFSDPMCSVLEALGDRIGVSSFYVSFFITPMSSNASELIAAVYFGKRKTRTSITLSYATLLGAATMNNTFCLSIFLGIVYFRELSWNFSAEVLAILLVELIMGILCLNRTFSFGKSLVVLALFPFSICVVAFFNYIGWK